MLLLMKSSYLEKIRQERRLYPALGGGLELGSSRVAVKSAVVCAITCHAECSLGQA